MNRKLVSSDLKQDVSGHYYMDLEDLEEKIIKEKVRLLFLCNPHNPVGRVWTKEELTALGDICVKHGVIVVSDEIHADFVFEGKHQVFAAIKKEFEEITITCTSPSKTFNLAGLMISNIFIADPENSATVLERNWTAAGISQLGVMGLVACEAAYSQGEVWYEKMHEYVKENIEYTREFVEYQTAGSENGRTPGNLSGVAGFPGDRTWRGGTGRSDHPQSEAVAGQRQDLRRAEAKDSSGSM